MANAVAVPDVVTLNAKTIVQAKCFAGPDAQFFLPIKKAPLMLKSTWALKATRNNLFSALKTKTSLFLSIRKLVLSSYLGALKENTSLIALADCCGIMFVFLGSSDVDKNNERVEIKGEQRPTHLKKCLLLRLQQCLMGALSDA